MRVGLVAGGIITAAAVIVGALILVERARHDTPTPAAAPSSTVTVAAAPVPAPTVTTVIVQAPAAATIAPAPKPSQVAVGSPVAEDPTFIARMQAQGWEIANQALMTLRAHQVCGALQQGATKQAVIEHLLSDVSPPPWANADVTQATQFVSTAMRTYPFCP